MEESDDVKWSGYHVLASNKWMKVYEKESEESQNSMLSEYAEYREFEKTRKCKYILDCQVVISKQPSDKFQVSLLLSQRDTNEKIVREASFSDWLEMTKLVIPVATFYRCTTLDIKLEGPLENDTRLPIFCEGNISVSCDSTGNIQQLLNSISCTMLTKIHLKSSGNQDQENIDSSIENLLKNTNILESIHLEGFAVNVAFLGYFNKLKFRQSTQLHMVVSGTLEEAKDQLPKIREMIRQTAGISLYDIHISLIFRIPSITTLLDQVFSSHDLALEKRLICGDYWTFHSQQLRNRISFITYRRAVEVSLSLTKYQRSSPPTRVRLSNGLAVRKTTLRIVNYRAEICGIRPVSYLRHFLEHREVVEVPCRYPQARRPPKKPLHSK